MVLSHCCGDRLVKVIPLGIMRYDESQSSDTGAAFGGCLLTERQRRRQQVWSGRDAPLEESTDVGYPTSDNVSDTVAAKYAEFGNALAQFAQTYSPQQTFNAKVLDSLIGPAQFTMAPPEWPIARLVIHLFQARTCENGPAEVYVPQQRSAARF